MKDKKPNPTLLTKKESVYMTELEKHLAAGKISPTTYKQLSYKYMKKIQQERREMIEEITNHLKSLKNKF